MGKHATGLVVFDGSTCRWEIGSVDRLDKGNHPGFVAHVKHRPDADLFAAAPEMLDALKVALAWIRGDDKVRSWVDASKIVEAAIAKAEGRSND